MNYLKSLPLLLVAILSVVTHTASGNTMSEKAAKYLEDIDNLKRMEGKVKDKGMYCVSTPATEPVTGITMVTYACLQKNSSTPEINDILNTKERMVFTFDTTVNKEIPNRKELPIRKAVWQADDMEGKEINITHKKEFYRFIESITCWHMGSNYLVTKRSCTYD